MSAGATVVRIRVRCRCGRFIAGVPPGRYHDGIEVQCARCRQWWLVIVDGTEIRKQRLSP